MARQLFEYHPLYAYKFIPRVQARVPHEAGGYLVRTNAQGFRGDRDFRRERQPQMRRVLLFGDSYTAGDGVSNGKRYGDLLEQMIPSLEVCNFGMPGTGTDQHYLIYENEAVGINHDLLIIAVYVENIRRIAAKYRQYADANGREVLYAKPHYGLEKGAEDEQLVLHGVPPRKEPLSSDQVPSEDVDTGGRFPRLRSVVDRLGMKDVAQRVTHYQPLPHYDDPQNPDWRLMRAILKRWIENHHKPVILFLLPMHQHIEDVCDPDAYIARFRDLADETSCTLCDPLPELSEYSAQERRAFRFARDIHPTPEGHRAFAKVLSPVVEHLLPAIGDTD